MNPRFLLPLAASLLLAVPATAQGEVEASLYARADEDGIVRALVRIEIEDGWHIYHEELGHPEAVGRPTSVVLEGEGIAWSEPRFPEPFQYGQGLEGKDGKEIWIWSHEGKVPVYFAGRLAEGASVEGISASVSGLVCEEACIPFSVEAKSEGRGPDRLFAAFPADLVPPREDQIEVGNADATLYHRVQDGKVEVAIAIEIEDGWHIYDDDIGHPDAAAKPTWVTLESEGVRWSEVRFPEPVRHEQGFENEAGEAVWTWIHWPPLVLHAQGELEEGASLGPVEARIEGLTCKDEVGCIPYAETIYSRGAGPDELFASTTGADSQQPQQEAQEDEGVAASSTTRDSVAQASLGRFLLLAVLWGLFTLLMPCTYPMIPITISFFTKQAEARGGKVLPLSLLYGVGIVLVFVLIGVVIGRAIIPFATHPMTNLVIAVLFIYFAFVLFGLLQLNPPRFLMDLAGKASMTGGYLGVFLMGTTLVVTSFTCTAPFVGSLLSFGAAGGDLGRVVLGMSVFGLTIAIPFVFLSLVPGKIQAMPRSGEWMNTLKVALGFVELAAALKFLSNSDLGWDWFVLSYELFLFLWMAIFLVMALYLFGVFAKDRPGIGPKRRGIASLTLVMGLYCGWGASGNKLDPVMMAIAPPYSGGRLLPVLYERDLNWTIVKDDYDQALRIAREEGKLLFANFTGFT
jgi:thiol:disulfide interchange protein DsbD